MRKTALKYRVTALFMASLMMISSTGIAMDMHYCQDELKGISLIGDAPTCHEKAARFKAPSCHKKAEKKCHNEEVATTVENCKDDCCSHEVFHAQLDTDYLKSEYNPQFELLTFSQVFFDAYIEMFHFNSDRNSDHYLDYKPPQPDVDIPVLVQSFLI